MAEDLDALQAQLQQEQDLDALREQLRSESDQPIEPVEIQPEIQQPPMDDLTALQAQLQDEKPEQDEGFFSNLETGAMELGGSDYKRRIKLYEQLRKGEIPEPIPVTPSPEWELSRKSIGQNVGRIGANIAPGLAATGAGVVVGGGVGSVVPVIGTGAGALAGGTSAAMAEARLSSFLDAYNEARLGGASHEDSIKSGETAGKISAAAAGILTPLGAVGAKDAIVKQAVKQVPIQSSGAATEKIAQNVAVKAQGIDPERGIMEGVPEAAATGAVAGPLQAAILRKPAQKMRAPDAENLAARNRRKGTPELGGTEREAGATPEVSQKPKGPKGPDERGKTPAPTEMATDGLVVPEPETARTPFVRERPSAAEPLNRQEQIEHLETYQEGLTHEQRRLSRERRWIERDLQENPGDFELERQLAEAENNSNILAKSTEDVSKELESLRSPKEAPVREPKVPKVEKKEPPRELAVQKKPGPPVVAKAPPKEVKGERVKYDTDVIYKKIHNKGGEHIPPVEVGIVDKSKDFIKRYWDDSPIETAVFDWQTPIRKVGETGTGAKREAENIPLRTARATLHTPGQLNAAFEHGTPAFDKHHQMMALKPNSKGLMPIVRPGLKTTQKARDLGTYLYGKRVQSNDLVAQGREKNITSPEASAAVALGEANPEFKNISQDLNNYMKSMRDWTIDTGLSNNRDASLWTNIDYVPFHRDTGDNGTFRSPRASIAGQKPNIKYLSGGARQYMVLDKNNNVLIRTRKKGEANRAKKAAGKGAQLINVGPATNDIFENLIKNVSYLVASGTRNVAAQNSIRAGQNAGVVHRIQRKDAAQLKSDGERVVTAYFDGRERFYTVDNPGLYDALTKMGANTPAEVDAVTKVLAKHKSFVSAAIVLEPSIAAGIAAKDLQRMMITGKNSLGGVRGIAEKVARNYKTAVLHEMGIKRDPRIIEIAAAGGDSIFFGKKNKSIMEDAMKEAHKTDGVILDPAWHRKMTDVPQKAVKKVVGAAEKTGRAAEWAHRLSVYDAAMEAGRGKGEAIFEASDFMDYKIAGKNKTLNWFNRVVPFLKTALQGIHKLAREIRYNKGFNRTTKALMTVAGIATTNALINAIPDDSEETEATGYNTIPDSSKNAYMHIDLYKNLGRGSSSRGQKIAKKLGLPRWLKVFIPWGEGAMSMSIPARIVDSMREDKDTAHEIGQIGQIALNQVHLNPAPPIVKELYEQLWGPGGYDTATQNPIIPQGKQNLEPELQSKDSTTTVAKGLGSVTGISPARLDHAASTLFGSIFSYITTLPDVFNQEVGEKKEWSERYFGNKFMRGELAKSNAFENELYETAKAAQKAYNSINEYEKQGMEDRREDYLKDKGEIASLNEDLKERLAGLKEFRDEISMIRKDKSISSTEKKEQIDSIIQSKNEFLLETHKAMLELKKEAADRKKDAKKTKIVSSKAGETPSTTEISTKWDKKPPPPPPKKPPPPPASSGSGSKPTPPPSKPSSSQGDMRRTINDSAKKVGVNPDLSLAIATAENGPLDPNSINIGAHGLYQFEKPTWRGAIKEYDGAKHGITEKDILDPKANAYMGNMLIKDHHQKLTKFLGRTPTDEEQYAVHFSGWEDGRKLLSAIKRDPSLPSSAVYGMQAIRDNPKRLKGKTVQQVFDGLTDRLNTAKREMLV